MSITPGGVKRNPGDNAATKKPRGEKRRNDRDQRRGVEGRMMVSRRRAGTTPRLAGKYMGLTLN